MPQVVEARPAERRRLGALPWAQVLTAALLILIVAVGAYFRFVGLDWDQDQHLHPDERFLTMVISSLERPDSVGAYFDTETSRYNPHNTGWGFFVYGTLPIFIIRLVGEYLDKTTYGEIYLVGRALSGVFDLLTVLLLFFIARRLYDTRIALLSAALSAAAVLQIQQSHFMTVDSFSATFTMLAFLGAVLVAQEGKLWQYLLLGLAIGMAVASRINLVLLGPLAVAAAGLYLRRTLAGIDDAAERSRAIERAILQLVLAGIVSLVAFRIFQPYAFQGPGFFGVRINERWLQNMREISAQASGEIDMPPSHQWTSRPAYLFPLSHMVLWGLGLPLGVVAWVGWLVAGWQLLRKRRWQHALPVAWVFILFAYQGQQFTKTMRYFLQIYPTLALLAAWFLIWLWDNRFRLSSFVIRDRAPEHAPRTTHHAPRTTHHATRAAIIPGTLLLLLVLAGTYAWAFAFTRIYTRPVTRVTASRWIYQNVPSAATVHYATAGGALAQTQVPVYLDRSVYAGNGYVVEPGGIPFRTTFAPVADGNLGTVTFDELQDTENDTAPEVLDVSLAADPTGQNVLATRQLQANLEQPAGPHIVDFAGVPVQADQRYYVFVRAAGGGVVKIVGRDVGTVAYQTDSGPQTERLRLSLVLDTDRTGVVYRSNRDPNVSSLRLSEPGTVRSVTMNYLIDPLGDPEAETFRVTIAEDPGGQQVLAQGDVTAHMEATDDPHGSAYTVEFAGPAQLEADREYFFITQAVEGAPVQAWSSVIANEHWDDAVPLRLDGKDGFGMYMGFDMKHYDNDNPETLDRLINWLDAADYVMITSNRLYGSIPRLPMRYPITTEYYNLLFQGKLGFEEVRDFTSYPSIGPLEIPDQSAEEAFTVYDHPKVLIFRKTEDFSRAKVRQMLADEAEGPFIFRKPIEVSARTATAPSLMLSDSQWARQQAAGTWSAIFSRDSIVNTSVPLTILVWLLAVEIVGLAVFPLAFVAFGRLADRGFIISKALGLLLLAWLVWFLSSLTPLPYARWSIGLCLLVLAGISTIIAYRNRDALTRFLAEHRRLLLLGEGLFLLAFVAFLLVRMGNPDLWHPARGGEKPMDFAYLNAVIKSRSFPPYDPWFAGGYINYYYFGFVIVGTLIKLLGIVPASAYNLAVPTLFGLTFVGAFAVVYNLTMGKLGELTGTKRELKGKLGELAGTKGELKGNLAEQPVVEGSGERHTTHHAPRTTLDVRAVLLGVLGGLFVAVAGNLEEVQVLLQGLRNVNASGLQSTIPGLATLVGALRGLWQMVFSGHSLGIPNDWWFWNASRVMPHGEINEFPYFTFVYADLHAHMIALPVTLLALAMAVQFIRNVRRPRTLDELGISLAGPPALWRRIDWPEVGQLALWALIIGSLRAINTWDYPTYLVVAAGALGIREVWRRRRIDLTAVWEAGWRFAVVVVFSTLFFWPYIQDYATAYTSAQLWHGERATLGDYLTIHGFFLFILGTFLIVETLDWWRGRGRNLWSEGGELSLAVQYGVVLIVLALAGLAYLRMWVPALGVLFAVPAALLALRSDVGPRRRLVGLLALAGMLLTLMVEVVVLKGDIGRMNTVFKFYIQVWVLWGVAAATSLAWIVPRLRRWEPNLRQAWGGVFAVLFACVLLYPLLATPAKIRDRFDQSLGPGLDGAAFMRTAQFYDEGQDLQLRYDCQAIQWIQENIAGTPVVLEGQTVEYRWGSRVSIYTGLPTVLGWRWHQQQQHSAIQEPVVDRRLEDVKTMFNTPDPQTALDLMRQYDVAYVYVGPLERAYYDANGLAKFERMAQAGTLEQIYQNPAVTIYRVTQEAPERLSLQAPISNPSTSSGQVIRSSASIFQRPSSIRPAQAGSVVERDVQPDLLLDRPVDQLPVVADRGWNRLANASPLLSVVSWWLVLLFVGLVAWPLVVVALPRFRDRGSVLARVAGLILVGYLVWIAASLRWLENTPATAYAMLALVGALSFFVLWRRRDEIVAFVRRRWRLILAEEALFTLAFLLFVGIRLLDPDLWQPWTGGEKPMEFAFLNAILKSAHFPPYDPFFAGGTINYYYYGLYLVGVLIKLTGIVPEVAFNLAVPTLFGLTVAGAFSVVYNAIFGRGEARGKVRVDEKGSFLPRASPLLLGLAGVLFVAVIGNLDGIRQIFEQLQRTGNVGSFDFWRSSRVIPFTINEFPYFSFLFADLHPHMINIAFSIFVLALLLHLVKAGETANRNLGESRGAKGNLEELRGTKRNLEGLEGIQEDLKEVEEMSEDPRGSSAPSEFPLVPSSSPSFPLVPSSSPSLPFVPSNSLRSFTLENALFAVALILGLGAVFVINLWELPAYLGLTLAVLVLRSRLATGKWQLVRNGLTFAGLAGLAYAAYRPFYAHYTALHIGLATVEEGSALTPFLTVWGFFLFVLASYLVMALLRSEGARWLVGAWRHRARLERYRRLSRRLARFGWLLWLGLLVLVVSALLSVGLLRVGEPVLALMVPLAGAAGVLLLRRQVSAGQQFAALLACVGLCVVAGTEVVYLKDFLAGGEWYRMNTVFKFTTEAWVLIALASAVAVGEIWRGLDRSALAQAAWAGTFGALLLAVLVYPIYGTAARVDERFPGQRPPVGTLNGMAFMRVGEYHWPDDNTIELAYTYDALEWLLNNVRGTPVVAEANIGYYREGGLRVATYTGLPVLLGFHQGEQRYDWQVDPRSSQADTLFRTQQVRQALDIINELNVSYVYVGQLERAWYPEAGIKKFDDMRRLGLLEVAYQNPKVTIYHVLASDSAMQDWVYSSISDTGTS